MVGMDLSIMVMPVVKNLPASAGVVGSIPGSRRSPGKGNGNPLQYSCLEHSMDRGAWLGYSSWGCEVSDTTKQLSTWCVWHWEPDIL